MAKPKKHRRKAQRPSKDQLEGRNIIVEVLRRKKRPVHELFVDARAKQDHKIAEILSLAKKRKIPVHSISRQELDSKSVTGVHNGVIAIADPHPSYNTKSSTRLCKR